MPDQPIRVPVGQLQATPTQTVTVPVSQLRAAPASAPTEDANRIGGMFSRFLGEVNPFPALLKANTEAATVIQTALSGQFKAAGKRTLDDLVGIAHATGTSQAAPFQKGMENAQKGDYATAARNFAMWLVPLAGPRMDESADLAQQGKYWESAGVASGTAFNFLGPEALSQVAKFRRTNAALTPPSPMTDAVRFARENDIPMTVAQANGNVVARAVDQLNERSSISGSIVAKGAREKQAEALTRVGTRLADEVHPTPAVPEQAGQAVVDAVANRASQFNADANAAYGRLRSLEQQQAARIADTGGVRGPATSARPFATVPLAVDVAPTKAAMQPTYAALMRKKELVGSLQGHEARALTSLDALMQAPDLAPLSVADSALSDLKDLARVDQDFRRTAGQGVAAQAVMSLDRAVLAAAQQGGREVFTALMDGRSATVNKFKARAVFDTFVKNGVYEPVGVFRKLTANQDTAVSLLTRVQREAPDQLPQIGRAYLDGLLQKATVEGGFGREKGLFADWQNLGPRTKQLLFRDPQRIKALDDFFLFAKKASENVNPSGSAFTGVLTAKGLYVVSHPITGAPMEIAQGALAKAMWDPRVVNLLTKALRTPTTATMTSRAVATDVVRALGVSNAAGRALTLAPAAAEEETTPRARR